MNQARRAIALSCALLLFVVAGSAEALELKGGMNLGAVLAGTDPHLAVSPHVGLSWRTEGGFLFAIHEVCNILPATNKLGTGVYNQTSAAVGYAWENGNFLIGPTFSAYSMPACGTTLCGRVVGVAAGGHIEADMYFAGPLGVSVSANMDWLGGRSLVLPGGLAGVITGGPVIRWRSK